MCYPAIDETQAYMADKKRLIQYEGTQFDDSEAHTHTQTELIHPQTHVLKFCFSLSFLFYSLLLFLILRSCL
jgi:hypothetical protein